MRASSREALHRGVESLGAVLERSDDTLSTAMRVGSELFEVVAVLDNERQLRTVVADSSVAADNRAAIIDTIFGGRVSEQVRVILDTIARETWANSYDMRAGIVELARRSFIRAAECQGQRDTVEQELFELARILEHHGTLTQLLSDKNQDAARRRELLASVLYGKVTAITETLALHIISRTETNPIEDLDNVASLVARVAGKTIARITTAAELSDEQKQQMVHKLGAIYGCDLSLHSEVNPSLLGGVVVRVNNEVIDGSIAGKLEKMRRVFA